MNAARAVLVTGATGLVGRRLVASLRGDGRAVRIVSRSVAPEGFDTGVEVVSWNGRDLPREAFAGVGALVHLAGEPVFGPLPTATHMRRVRTSRVESTEALVAALGALPANERPECFVCASAVGYYGSRGDAQLDESAEPGDGLLAEVCTAWERAARGAEPLGIRTVRLRIGIVLAHEGGALPLIAQVFRVGLGGRLGDGRQWFPWIAIDDLIALVRTAIDDPRWSGAVNAVAPGVVHERRLHARARPAARPPHLAAGAGRDGAPRSRRALGRAARQPAPHPARGTGARLPLRLPRARARAARGAGSVEARVPGRQAAGSVGPGASARLAASGAQAALRAREEREVFGHDRPLLALLQLLDRTWQREPAPVQQSCTPSARRRSDRAARPIGACRSG
jgi:uncharacterized protein (TIGR01777 family)